MTHVEAGYGHIGNGMTTVVYRTLKWHPFALNCFCLTFFFNGQPIYGVNNLTPQNGVPLLVRKVKEKTYNLDAYCVDHYIFAFHNEQLKTNL